MLYARQSTAQIVTVGPVMDADGVAVTDSVVGDFKISKNGAAPAALNGSATLTHRHTGHYSLSLTATDLNTVGTAEVTCDDTVNACPVKEIQVVEPATYDVLFADAAPGPASPTNITAGTITTATNVTTVNGLAANVITAAATATDFGTEIAGAVWDLDATAHQTQGTFGQAIGDPAADTNTIYKAVVTDATGATVGADVVAVKAETAAIVADTNELQTDWANGGRLDLILDARASQASVDTVDGIVDAILVDTAEIGVAGAGLTAADDAVMARLGAPAGASVSADIAAVKSDSAAILTDTAEIGAAGAGLTAIATQASVNTVDTVVDAIKAKTDSLTFTVAGSVDANLQQVNDVTIVGNGSGTPFNV